jgi:hypothetical protein
MQCPFLYDLWRDIAGLSPMAKPPLPTLNVLRQEEWDPAFERLMRNRLLMGCYRYERLWKKRVGQYDLIGSAKQRIAKYEQTGNLEPLVDVANLMLIEFNCSKHPHRHFVSEDDGQHCKVIR